MWDRGGGVGHSLRQPGDSRGAAGLDRLREAVELLAPSWVRAPGAPAPSGDQGRGRSGQRLPHQPRDRAGGLASRERADPERRPTVKRAAPLTASPALVGYRPRERTETLGPARGRPGGSPRLLEETPVMDNEHISVSLELDVSGESLTGRARHGTGEARSFAGWLGLLGAIDALLAEKDGPCVRGQRPIGRAPGRPHRRGPRVNARTSRKPHTWPATSGPAIRRSGPRRPRRAGLRGRPARVELSVSLPRPPERVGPARRAAPDTRGETRARRLRRGRWPRCAGRRAHPPRYRP